MTGCFASLNMTLQDPPRCSENDATPHFTLHTSFVSRL